MTTRKITFEKFIEKTMGCTSAFLRSTGQRRGQYAFNLLDEHRRDLADKIVKTDNDPFYEDERIPQFLVWLEKNWENTCASTSEVTSI